MAHLATQWLSSLNRLLSRLIRNWFSVEGMDRKWKEPRSRWDLSFTDEKSALAYLEKHTARLKNLGVEEVVAKVFDVNEPLSQINQAKLAWQNLIKGG